MGWITGIEIIHNEEDQCYKFKFETYGPDTRGVENKHSTVISREFSYWADCVELLHDKIMRWMQDNSCVENWSEDAAEDRFNLTDYYLGKVD